MRIPYNNIMAELGHEGATAQNQGNHENVTSQQPGKWTEHAETFGWTKPADAVKTDLTRIRRLTSQSPSVIQALIPQDHQSGEALQLATEVRALFVRGTIGTGPDAHVTVEEVSAAAGEIWDLDEKKLTELRETILPEAEQWHENQKKEKQASVKENDNRFILATWDQARFDVLRNQVLPHVTTPNFRTELERFTAEHENDLVRAFDAGDTAAALEDVTERRAAMQQAVDRILELASQITRLHPEEIRKISINEHSPQLGYLYLDSIGPIHHVLAATYNAAERFHANTDTDNQTEPAFDERAQALRSLLYGAKESHEVQSATSYLTRADDTTIYGPRKLPGEE